MLISYWRKYEEDLCIFAKSEEKFLSFPLLVFNFGFVAHLLYSLFFIIHQTHIFRPKLKKENPYNIF